MIILGFGKDFYYKENLDSLNDECLYYEACDNDITIIFEDIKDFQNYLNSEINHSDEYWWYFINK